MTKVKRSPHLTPAFYEHSKAFFELVAHGQNTNLEESLKEAAKLIRTTTDIKSYKYMGQTLAYIQRAEAEKQAKT
jgi:hypothetical protein